MSDRSQAPSNAESLLDSVAWHPEPELIAYRDPTRARPALTELGEETWRAALDYVYEEGMRRPVAPEDYQALRERFFGAGPDGPRPAPAPAHPISSAEILAEFRTRLAPYTFNAAHPRSYSYFTPPPLAMSVAGDVLASWMNQGVDVWHAGPIASLVEEEVVGWLVELAGYGPDGFGILTSGGLMANLIGLTLARDVHAPRLYRGPRLRGQARWSASACTPPTRPTSPSRARSACWGSLPMRYA